jgi:hypothetical protein
MGSFVPNEFGVGLRRDVLARTRDAYQRDRSLRQGQLSRRNRPEKTQTLQVFEVQAHNHNHNAD